MKRPTTRVLSLLLACAIVFSGISIYAGAITGQAEGSASALQTASTEAEDRAVFYNRTYDEIGLDALSGLVTAKKSNSILVKTEKQADGETMSGFRDNTYIELKMRESAESVEDCYVEVPLSTSEHELVVEVDLMIPREGCTSFNLQFKYASDKNARDTGTLFDVDRSGAVAASKQSVGTLSADGWTTLAAVLDLTAKKADYYLNGTKVLSGVSLGLNQYQSIISMRLYCAAGVSNAGRGICIDNYRVYAGNALRELPVTDGIGTESTVAPIDAVKNSLVMKVAVPSALVNGEKRELGEGASPIKIKDRVYVPLETVAIYAGGMIGKVSSKTFTVFYGDTESIITIGNSTAYVSGNTVQLPDGDASVLNCNDNLMVSLSTVELLFNGKHVTYDEMGLILIDDTPDLLTREQDLSTMIQVMESFVYEDVEGKQIIADMEEKHGMSHPRLYVTGERFEELRALYEAEETEKNKVIKGWLSSLVSGASASVASTKNPTYGYDVGNRMGTSAQTMVNWGFAYKMTGDLKYAERSLSYIYALSQFDDWCPGHSLNNADTAQGVAVAYDWMYDVWDNTALWTVAKVEAVLGAAAAASIPKNEDGTVRIRQFIEDTLYYFAIASAIGSYNGTTNQQNTHGTFGRATWTATTNNWNAVCNAGYLMCCLALADVTTPIGQNMIPTSVNTTYSDKTTVDTPGTPLAHLTSSTAFRTATATATTTYREEIAWLMTNIMKSIRIGVRCYAPDGSYEESPGYWAYATNQVFKFCENLLSATGTDYGIMNAAGLDTTGYFPLYIESSDNKTWNYHDSGAGGMDTSHLAWVSTFFGDNDLYTLRYQQVASGDKAVSFIDALYYDPSRLVEKVELTPDFYFQGIETSVFRTDWERGSIYTGLHGGYNSVNHGDIDAGTFIYDAEGLQWIVELGSDNYNLSGYFGKGANGASWKYYRKTSEGQNTIVIANSSEVRFGQNPTATIPTVGYHSEENGGWSILDMTSAYGSTCSSARRGLLLTNSRTTTVLQDEISFSAPTSLYWFAHVNSAADITLSENGRTAYIRMNGHTLRASILTTYSASGLKFTVMEGGEAVLPATTGAGEGAVQQETSRESVQKLSIYAENVMSFHLAVVFEIIESPDDAVGYRLIGMDGWSVSDDAWLGGDGDDDSEPNPEPEPDPDEPPVVPEESYDAFDFFSAARELDAASGFYTQFAALSRASAIYAQLSDKEKATVADTPLFYNVFLTYEALANEYLTYYDSVSADFALFRRICDGTINIATHPAEDAVHAAD